MNPLELWIRNLVLPCVVAGDNGLRQINNIKTHFGFKNKTTKVMYRDVFDGKSRSGYDTIEEFECWAGEKLEAIGVSRSWER